jgi:non-heme chloroperoxidase
MHGLRLVPAILLFLAVCENGAAQTDEDALQVVRVNEVELHYLARGRGEPLVFVHGGLDDYRMWQAEIEPFAERYHVIDYSRRYSFPNHNAPAVADYSAVTDSEDLAALIRKLQLGPVRIVAHSYGGYAALFLVVRHPELVHSLVLAEPAVLSWANENPEAHPLFVEQMEKFWYPVRDALLRGNDEEALRITLDYFDNKGAYDQLPEQVRDQLRQDLPEWRALTESKDPFPRLQRGAVARMNKAVLLLTGQNTLPIFRSIDAELLRLLPGTRQVVIPNAKHEMWADNEEACRRATLEFLAEGKNAERRIPNAQR